MDFLWIDETALVLPGAQKDYKAEWEATRYLIGDKMFAMLGEHKDGRKILSVKLPPADGVLLREEYEDIIPGYYMNKEHWNSIYLDGEVPQDLMQKMLVKSHSLILASLPKKRQKEILEP